MAAQVEPVRGVEVRMRAARPSTGLTDAHAILFAACGLIGAWIGLNVTGPWLVGLLLA